MELAYRCNWGYNEYTLAETRQELSDIVIVRIAGENHNVFRRRETNYYIDSGFRGEQTSWNYYIKTELFGETVEFKLNELIARGIKVDALSYEISPVAA